MPSKDIFYLELWRPFCSAGQNHLRNFGRGYQEQQFCEINYEFGPVVQEMLFKDISGHFVQRSKTICAVLVEDIMRNNSAK